MRPTLLLLALMMTVAGCGHKGPLYLPGEKPAREKSSPKPVPAPATSPSAQQ